MRAEARERRWFYGWIVVAAVFVVTLIGFGSAYTFSSFFAPLQSQFDATRGSASLVFSIAGFLYFGLGVVTGPLANRLGVRTLTAIGMALVGLGMIMAGQARNIFQVYAAYGLGIGLGVGCAYVPALGAVQRWFVKRRGFASGLAVSGIGVGTLVMPPLAEHLIASLGWRAAYVSLGILAIIVGVLAAVVIDDDPARRGMQPDGLAIPSNSEPRPTDGMAIGEIVRTWQFLGLYLACLLSALGVFVPFVHLVPYAIDHGISPAIAVWLLGGIGIGSTIGRFFLGRIADSMGREKFLIAMYTGMAASLAIWSVAGSLALLVLFALAFGLFYGGWVAILPAVVADLFGGKYAGSIIGALYTSVGIGTLLGPSGAGFIYDHSHSYLLSIAIGAFANLSAAIITIVASLVRGDDA
jgi:MFS transporter, OFA family, oxalate/formate antiporter